MADIRFSCQACHQHITCDEAWGGHQIQCPVCSKTITVPPKVTATAARAAAPAPAPSTPSLLVPKVPEATKLAFQQNAQRPAPAQQKHIPIRDMTGPPPKKEGPWKTIGIVGAIIVILGAAGYFGWPYVSKMLNKEEAQTQAQADPGASGTRPAAAEPGGAPEAPPPPDAGQPANPVTEAPTNIVQTGPVIPALHTLEIASAKIPSGRVNGKVSGNNFLPEIVRIDPVGPTQVLRFSQGELLSPDAELLVYLRLKPGDKLEGKKINVSADLRTTGLPQVMKRWKTNPKYAPTVRSFSSGYVMKLELNQHTNGVVRGKFYLALPDKEQTVAAGNFAALTTIPVEGVLAPDALPTANPLQPGGPMGGPPTGPEPSLPPEYQQRYRR